MAVVVRLRGHSIFRRRIRFAPVQAGRKQAMSAGGFLARPESRIGIDPIVVGILLFFAGHTAIRLFGTSNFSVDETMTAIHTQRFHLFYVFANPPLFDWLYFGLSRVLGTSLLTMQILKTALLGGGAVFFYLAVRPCFRHRAALAGAMASYGATAFYGWEILQLYSHTNALIFSLGFTLWALMRVVHFRRTVDYVLLGVGLALGILSKYLFGLFFVALVVAAVRSPGYRSQLLSWRSVLTLAVATVLVSPLLYGLSGSIDAAMLAVGHRVAAGNGVVLALANFAIQSAQFWLPFAVILWVCLARWPAAVPVRADNQEVAAVDDESFYPLLRDATLLMVAMTLALVMFLGTRITAGHYLVPVLTLLPVAIFAGLDRSEPFPALAIHKYLQGALAVIVAVAVIRLLLFLFVSPPFCVPRCILFVDYTPVVEKLGRSHGKQSVILSDDIHIASNLLSAIPNARVIVPTETAGLDVGLAAPGDRYCAFVWFRRYRDSDERPLESALRRMLRRAPLDSELEAIGPTVYVEADWQTRFLRGRWPATIIGIAMIDSASPLCEGGERMARQRESPTVKLPR
jgi:hypothetical protein